MGIPYSREINAAFEQVTPLVAAGFKVLKTTQNISILLAVIQVLTVLFLALILIVLLGILYSVNPDLEHERKTLVTPFFRYLARISFIGIIQSILATLVGFAGFLGIGSLLLNRRDLDAIEDAGNEDANKALEDLDKENKEKKKGKGKKNEKGETLDGVE